MLNANVRNEAGRMDGEERRERRMHSFGRRATAGPDLVSVAALPRKRRMRVSSSPNPTCASLSSGVVAAGS